MPPSQIEYNTSTSGEIIFGAGSTVMKNKAGVPSQPFNIGVTEYSITSGDKEIFIGNWLGMILAVPLVV